MNRPKLIFQKLWPLVALSIYKRSQIKFFFTRKLIKSDGYAQVIYTGQAWLPMKKEYSKLFISFGLFHLVFHIEKRCKKAKS